MNLPRTSLFPSDQDDVSCDAGAQETASRAAPAMQAQWLQLLRQCSDASLSRPIHIALDLNLFDAWSDELQSLEELSLRLEVGAASLRRVLQALCTAGLVTRASDDRYALSSLGCMLRRDNPQSLRFIARLLSETLPVGRVPPAQETGFPHSGMSSFDRHVLDYYVTQPANLSFVDHAAVWSTPLLAEALLEAWEPPSEGSVVDVGGGRGHLLHAILRARPKTRGVLFELERAVAMAHWYIQAAGLEDRCEIIRGDFFRSVPGGGTVYVLQRVLSEWDDYSARRILSSCRWSMLETSRLVLIERSPARFALSGSESEFARDLDLLGLMEPGSRERSAADYEHLLSLEGFAMGRVIGNVHGAMLIEARPVSSAKFWN